MIPLVALSLFAIAGAAFAGPIWVEPCSKLTCQKASSDKLPDGEIIVSGVLSVSPSLECPGKCSDIATTTARIHAMGKPRDIFAKSGVAQRVYGKKED